MRIGICDNNSLKFTRDLKEHWEFLGHEVKYESGASEKIAQWAEIYYCEEFDNNIHYLYDLYHDDPRKAREWMGNDWDNSKKPLIVVRPLDWCVWIGYMRDQKIVDWCDKIIFIAKHIQDRVNAEVQISSEKQALIKPGVNLERFTLKAKQTDGFQLGMVLGDMWKYKNHMGGLDIFTILYQKDPRWRLHIRGQHESGIYDPENYEYYLKSRHIEDVVTLYPTCDDMNQWFENIDILLHPGQKEAFCYAVGEALAKGIPVVINDFLGSHDIWGEYDLYQTHIEAIDKILNLQEDLRLSEGGLRKDCRKYIERHYPTDRMFKEMDQFIGL